MSTALYEVGGDFGNWAAKVVRDGYSTVIRNVAVQYDGSDDALRELGLFGGVTAGDEPLTESVQLTLRDQQWIVGEAAFTQSARSFERTTYSRYGTDEWYALVAAALVSLYSKRSGTVALTFSLPVSQLRAGRAREIRELLAGQWQIGYDGRVLTYEILPDLIDMIPEGFGSLAYLCLSESGKRFTDRALAENRVVLFDFGGYTLDVITFDRLSMGPYNESLTTGLINVRNDVNKALKRIYNRGDVPGKVLDEVIRTRQYRHAGGKPDDVSTIVDTALVSLMKDALRVWQEELGSGADYDTVIVSGGGGPVIGPLLAPQLGHHDIRIIPEGEAHLANALGSLRHRKFKREYMQA
ncbi:MAG: ParM/StbA family protein [Anaerolineae bacterium]|nr:ParM/StbA family protein [Anaerolineae bacterium]